MPTYNNDNTRRERAKFRRGKKHREEPAIRRIVRENIKGRRLLMGLPQWKLGELCSDTSQVWIQQLENDSDDAMPTLLFLEKVASALTCTVADLVTSGKYREGLKIRLPRGRAVSATVIGDRAKARRRPRPAARNRRKG